MKLFKLKPKWMSSSEIKALNYVRNETDENLLLRAALESTHPSVCTEAVKKLKSDGAILRYLHDGTLDNKKMLLASITDKKLLRTITYVDDVFVKFYAFYYGDGAYKATELLVEMAKKKKNLPQISLFIQDLPIVQAVSVVKWISYLNEAKVSMDILKSRISDEEEYQKSMLDIAAKAHWQIVRQEAEKRITLPHLKERINEEKATAKREEYLALVSDIKYGSLWTLDIRKALNPFEDPQKRAEMERILAARAAKVDPRDKRIKSLRDKLIFNIEDPQAKMILGESLATLDLRFKEYLNSL